MAWQAQAPAGRTGVPRRAERASPAHLDRCARCPAAGGGRCESARWTSRGHGGLRTSRCPSGACGGSPAALRARDQGRHRGAKGPSALAGPRLQPGGSRRGARSLEVLVPLAPLELVRDPHVALHEGVDAKGHHPDEDHRAEGRAGGELEVAVVVLPVGNPLFDVGGRVGAPAAEVVRVVRGEGELGDASRGRVRRGSHGGASG
mmetsp:Transcript_6113/g.20864  ORF Transcript_6113/g.20864 Transcript_6113/m.20864 type:complete len:204 (+) Transcript_6113:173-784(+)